MQIKLNFIDWDRIKEAHRQVEINKLLKKIEFLQKSRASYIGKFKNKKWTK